VTLFDAATEIGGQFNIAKQVPGKEEFYETLRYFRQADRADRREAVKLGRAWRARTWWAGLRRRWCWPPASTPRVPDIEGIDHPKVLGYLDVLRDKKPVGKTRGRDRRRRHRLRRGRVPAARGRPAPAWKAKFFAEWGVDDTGARSAAAWPRLTSDGSAQGLPAAAQDQQGGRRPGQDHGLDPPHRLKNRGVEMIAGVTYRKMDDAGLHITVGGKTRCCRWTTWSSAPGRTRSASCRPRCRPPA
jgi:2,4-dienoyl-CoA reductase (NADPH2)